MKLVAKTFLTGALLTSAMVSTAAMAAQKIGIVNVEGIFQQMPQTAAMQQSIEEEFKDRRAALAQMEKDIEYLLNKRQREAATMSEEEIKKLEGEIIAMRQDYAAKGQPLQKEIQDRAAAEQQKLVMLINQAINKIAADEEFDLVLRSQSAAFVKPEFNISERVLETVSKAD